MSGEPMTPGHVAMFDQLIAEGDGVLQVLARAYRDRMASVPEPQAAADMIAYLVANYDGPTLLGLALAGVRREATRGAG